MTRQSCGSGCVLERDEREDHGNHGRAKRERARSMSLRPRVFHVLVVGGDDVNTPTKKRTRVAEPKRHTARRWPLTRTRVTVQNSTCAGFSRSASYRSL